MKKHYIYCSLIGLVIKALSACTGRQPDMIFPAESWERDTPANQQIDSQKMLDALDYLKSKSFEDGNEEVMIIRNGRIIYEGDSILKRHNIWSCSKSFTSTVLGLVIEDDLVRLDDHVHQYESLLEEKYPKVTFRHFTTMTSGYNAVGSTRWNGESEDWSWTPYDPGEPIFEPGTQYAYWDEAMMMKGRVLTRVLGKTMKDYFDEKVGNKIGFGEWKWHNEGEIEGIPINNGCTNVIINATQLARFGHLYLNKGKWKGKQVIPESWVDRATNVQVPVTIPVADTDRKSARGSGAYGFNWWINGGLSAMPDAPAKTYYASGLNHNVCFVIPEWNMVIVRMGVDGNPPEGKYVVWNKFLKRLGKAVVIK